MKYDRRSALLKLHSRLTPVTGSKIRRTWKELFSYFLSLRSLLFPWTVSPLA
jgi:hypothetical protein